MLSDMLKISISSTHQTLGAFFAREGLSRVFHLALFRGGMEQSEFYKQLPINSVHFPCISRVKGNRVNFICGPAVEKIETHNFLHEQEYLQDCVEVKLRKPGIHRDDVTTEIIVSDSHITIKYYFKD